MTAPIARYSTLRPRLLPALGALLVIAALIPWLSPAEARREMLTTEDRARLRHASRVHVETLALTDKGTVDPAGIATAVAARLAEFGFDVEPNPANPYDAVLKVKCEEHKTWEGTARSGGDADSPGAVSRLWRGPACQLSYRLDGVRSDWRHEIRAESPGGAGPVPDSAGDARAAALAELTSRLERDPFPILLAAEWGQSERLLAALSTPGTGSSRKAMIIGLLGNIAAKDALPTLARSVHDSDAAVAQASAVAIGSIGHEDGIPILLSVFKKGKPELHRAAAQGLGRLAPLHPHVDVVGELLAALPQASVPIQTEIVHALATTADRRFYQAIRHLNRDLQPRYASDHSEDMLALKKAIGVALDQFTNTHSED